MIKVAMFLGVCIAIYAIFSYLEVKLMNKINEEAVDNFMRMYGNELLPVITEEVTTNITQMFLENHEILARIGMLSAINEVITDVNKETIPKTRTENNKESQRD